MADRTTAGTELLSFTVVVKKPDVPKTRPGVELIDHRRQVLESAKKYARRHLPEMRSVPLYGDDSNLGYYYVYISMAGSKNKFSVILDTGSGLTVVPCDLCVGCGTHMGNKYLGGGTATPCGAPCVATQGSCSASVCRFSISYSEGSKLSGKFVTDKVCLGAWDKCAESDKVPFSFGCATSMTNLFRTQLADGIMGVNNNEHTTLLDSLRAHHDLPEDIFSICLGIEGGEFVVGGYNSKLSLFPDVPEPAWVPQVSKDNFYRVKVQKVSVAGQTYVLNANAVLDSGTTYTFVPERLHMHLVQMFNTFCGKGHTTGDICRGIRNDHVDKDAVACYSIADSENITAAMHTFPAIEFSLTSETNVRMLPYQYFFPSGGGTQCIGLYADPDFILGMNFFQYNNVVFDKANNRVGFIPARCSNKDPFCNSGICYSNNMSGISGTLLAIMGAVSVMLSFVIIRLLYKQKCLPTWCIKCCPNYFCQCFFCCRKQTSYKELPPDEAKGGEECVSVPEIEMTEKTGAEKLDESFGDGSESLPKNKNWSAEEHEKALREIREQVLNNT
jgi:hypothetical protein|eukprot:Stramenopile-MAST_4_protein_4232